MTTKEIIIYIDSIFEESDEIINNYIISLENSDYEVNYETIWASYLAVEYAMDRLEMYTRALRDKLND